MSKNFSFRALKRVQALSLASILGLSASAFAETKTITNASYDVSRELYEEINPAFVKLWKEKKARRSVLHNLMAALVNKP